MIMDFVVPNYSFCNTSLFLRSVFLHMYPFWVDITFSSLTVRGPPNPQIDLFLSSFEESNRFYKITLSQTIDSFKLFNMWIYITQNNIHLIWSYFHY